MIRGLAVLAMSAGLLLPSLVQASDATGRCLAAAAAHYGVNLGVIEAIRKVEGGWPGARIANRNGTHDLGVMQINSAWLRNADLRRAGITASRLANDTCLNYWVAAWIYRNELTATGGDPWKAAGNYHSHTPSHHDVYERKVVAAWRSMGLGSTRVQAEMASAIHTPTGAQVRRRGAALDGPVVMVNGSAYSFPGGHVEHRPTHGSRSSGVIVHHVTPQDDPLLKEASAQAKNLSRRIAELSASN